MNDYTRTPNLALYKPSINGDDDLWGDHWNANADTLDSTIKSLTDELAEKGVTSVTPPPVNDGAFWFDGIGLQLFYGYDDGNSVQWVPATPVPPSVAEAPLDGNLYGRSSGAWTQVPTSVAEAPVDSNTYGRSGGAWVQVLSLTAGGTVTGPLVVTSGTINGAVIGGTTPAAGTFTPLKVGTTSNNQLTITPGAASTNATTINLSGTGSLSFGSGALTVTPGATGQTTAAGNLVTTNTGQALRATNGQIVSGGTTNAGGLILNGPTTPATRSIQWFTGATQRYNIVVNTADNFVVNGYDNLNNANTILSAARLSGPLLTGKPTITGLAPYLQQTPQATYGGGVIGNNQDFMTGSSDAQPVTTLAANPFSVTSGSPTITVTWAGSVSSGLIDAVSLGGTHNDVWVLISGATAVGGITPSGWYRVQTISAPDTFTITHSSNATSSATGGGSAVAIQPSFQVVMNKSAYKVTAFGKGYSEQYMDLMVIDPAQLQPLSEANFPSYQHRFAQTTTPDDGGTQHRWSMSAFEWDFCNRGVDYGYTGDLYSAAGGSNTKGFWIGALDAVPPYIASGGTAQNWNTAFSIWGTEGTVGVYDGFSVQRHALVGAARDPTSHGGVGIDIFGAQALVQTATVTNGSSLVTIVSYHGMPTQVNGNSVYIGGPAQTMNGVTYGGGVIYTISGVNTTTRTFQITGTGTASAGLTVPTPPIWMAFANLVPYAPYQAIGSFKHGLISHAQSRFESGGIVETQPGNGILWNDGTGTASVNASTISAGNINLTLNSAGTGRVLTNGALTIASGVTITAGGLTVSAGGASITGATTLASGATITTGGLTVSAGGLNITGAANLNTGGNVVGAQLTVGSNTTTQLLVVNGPTLSNRAMRFTTAGLVRWAIMANANAEGGSNAGSDYAVTAYDDGGTLLSTPLLITRSTGAITAGGALRVNGNVGFYNTAPVAKPTVSGAKGSNAALASLIAALVSQGLITDTTTA